MKISKERVDISPISFNKEDKKLRYKMYIDLNLIEKDYIGFYIGYKIKDLDILIKNLKRDLEKNW